MVRQRPVLFFILTFVLVSLACNAFAGNTEPELELPPPTIVTTLVADNEATVAGAAPTVTLPGGEEEVQEEGTAVPAFDGPFVTMLVDLNVRVGPGVQYDRVGFLLKGQSVPAIGVDPATGWWKIECPPTLEASECWVSGGAQYSIGTNTDGLPAAPVPPTPTSPPTPTATAVPDSGGGSEDNTGLVAYADSTGLWIVPVNRTTSPPTAGTPIQLSEATDISRPLLSPDGRRVAFLRGDSRANVLGFLNTDSEGGDMLIASVSLPNSSESADVAVLIDQFAWLPDSQALAFSSILVNQTGPGVQPQADLWTISLNRDLTETFPAGSGGHTFALSPNGSQVIFGLPESIVQANLDGSNAQTVLTFSFVNTASEYAYAPLVQWLANGTTAVTAVSGADPWQADTEAALYRIQNQTPLVQGNLPGNILFSPVQWTSTGGRLAYVQFIPDGSGEQTVIVAEGNGDRAQAVRTDNNLRVLGWNSADTHLLYVGDGYFGIGQSGATPTEVPVSVAISDGQWLGETAFVMSLGSGNIWNLTSANLSGETEILATANGNNVQFDTWVP